MKKNIFTSSCAGLVLLLGLCALYATPQTTLAGSQSSTTKEIKRVSLNTASLEDLLKIPGIGQLKAKKIIEHRKMKPFSKLEDLLSVPGFGKKLIERITPYVSL